MSTDLLSICTGIRFDAGGSVRTARCVAYSGHALRSSDGDRLIDVDSMRLPPRIPLLLEAGGPVGHFLPSKADGQVCGTAFVYASGKGAEVAQKADKGFPWGVELVIGSADPEPVEAGDTVRVNGRLFAGPVTVLRNASVRAIRLTSVSIDPKSELAFAAGWPLGRSNRFVAHAAGDLYIST